ncbi:MAG: bifunctional folylpolyglutamate synthase/dihydrofolate synthase [Lachnospiraceae bacterium]|nr:bifunctional folylpolyglutamate synthase/dihydrofolate synthase [Lachnospiraceae bacterium]
MNYKQAMEKMEQIAKKGSILGLEPISTLCEMLGNPQDKIKVIHIAGTNGKGSILAYLESMLIEGGYKVGKYSSPTLFSYLERFKVNGKEMSQEEFAESFTKAWECLQQMQKLNAPMPTAFEVETAIAFDYFLNKEVDVVLLETGMGGKLDATNIVKRPVCTVIASVDMDHMAFLGSTIKEIAGEKAGIIKEHVPVVVYPKQKEETKQVILERAGEKQAPFFQAETPEIYDFSLEKQSFYFPGKEEKKYEISLLGTHQPENASTALKVAEVIKECFPLTDVQIAAGLNKTRWIARFEIIRKEPLVIRDGAHNENAAARLKESLQKYFTKPQFIYIMGVLKDKEYEKIIDIMAPMTELVYVITPKNQRALPAEELKLAWSKHKKKVMVVEDPKEALKQAMHAYHDESGILCFGSLSFMSEITDV